MYVSQFELPEQESMYVLLLLLLISTMVMAEPESNLDIDNEVPELNVLSILNEEDWRNIDSEEKWRRPQEKSASKVRWGGYSIHQENEQVPGMIPTEAELDTMDRRKPVSQFNLEF